MLRWLVSAAVAVVLARGQPPDPGTAPEPEEGLLLSRYREEPLAGFTVLFHEGMGTDPTRERRVRAALLVDLETLTARVPAPALDVLRSVRILVNPPSISPRSGIAWRGMCFHPSAQWLEGAGFERLRAGTVEICNADDFLLWRAEQPLMVLHEMAHAYHCAIGFDRADVREAHAAAAKAGRFERVRHALLAPDQTQRAYALTNQHEYFAELSEAWFGRNDLEPFTRAELTAFDPAGAALVERLWGMSAEEIEHQRKTASPPPPEPLSLPGAGDR